MKSAWWDVGMCTLMCRDFDGHRHCHRYIVRVSDLVDTRRASRQVKQSCDTQVIDLKPVNIIHSLQHARSLVCSIRHTVKLRVQLPSGYEYLFQCSAPIWLSLALVLIAIRRVSEFKTRAFRTGARIFTRWRRQRATSANRTSAIPICLRHILHPAR